LYGVQVPAGDGMLVLAFRTDATSSLDLDVTIGPVNGGRVGGNNNLVIGTSDAVEWLAAYERIAATPSSVHSGARRTASRIFNPVLPTQTLTRSKGTATSDPTAALAELRRLIPPTVPAQSAPVGARPSGDQRNIEVLGANGTTGDYDLWYQTCAAFEIAIGQGGSDSLTTSDCVTFNFLSGSLTYGTHWVFDAAGGDTLDLRLTSTKIDPVLYLFGPSGALVAANDDSDSLNSRIVVTLPSNGQYIAFPTSYENLATGAFTLTIDFFVPGTAINYIEVTPEGVTIDGSGSTTQLTATAFDQSDQPIAGASFTWGTFNGNVATVDATGVVTAAEVGQAIIFAQSGSEVGSAVVTVTNSTAIPVSTWNTIANPASNTLWSVWGTASSRTVAVGNAGTILEYDGTTWSTMTSGTTTDLHHVWGAASDDIFAVGNAGTILHYDGTSWNPMASGTAANLWGVWGASPFDVFVVGGSGTILRYDGSTWTVMTSGTTNAFDAVWGSSVSDIFAVGNGGTIVHYDGASWQAMPNPATGNVYALWGTSGSDVFAGSDIGEIIHYDGTNWTSMSSGTSLGFEGLWGTSGSDVYAVGNSGTILHYDGTSWTAMTSPTADNLWGIWGVSVDPASAPGVFAVGSVGTILGGQR
ncbi:MAG: Ig-like domain-containing protein, partial [Gemmatimonadetes bacterium]|nr:Ig-like domain-containing protein [Gemmatimonadota bacterium]